MLENNIIKKFFIHAVLLFSLFIQITPAHAGMDEEFGEKSSWWRVHYNQFLRNFGIEKNYALVIGVSKYNDRSFQHLPSEKDAIRMKDYLINEAGFHHVRLITGDKVKVSKVQQLMLDHYPTILGSKDRFLFYWSGHGVTTQDARKQGYLAVQDSQSRMVSSMLSMLDLSKWDRRMKAKQTLYLLDACFSGMAASKAMSLDPKEATIERVSRPSSQVLTAGLDREQTIAISDMNGGVFTRALLDGLRGHADIEKGPFKKDGVVTARELEIYIRSRVDHERRRVKWDKPITPTLYNFARREGDFFFVSDKSVLVKPKELNKGANTKVVSTGLVIQTKPESIKKTRAPTTTFIVSERGFSVKGVGDLSFGDNTNKVYKIIGKPLKTRTWDGAKLDYHIYKDLDLAYNKTTRRLSHVIFRGNTGVTTNKGVKFGDKFEKVIQLYGQPSRINLTFKSGRLVYKHINFGIRHNKVNRIQINHIPDELLTQVPR